MVIPTQDISHVMEHAAVVYGTYSYLSLYLVLRLNFLVLDPCHEREDKFFLTGDIILRFRSVEGGGYY